MRGGEQGDEERLEGESKRGKAEGEEEEDGRGEESNEMVVRYTNTVTSVQCATVSKGHPMVQDIRRNFNYCLL